MRHVQDAAIRCLLSLYCPDGRQGKSKQTTMNKSNSFAGHFDGHSGAPVQYRVHCPMEKVRGFDRSHWMPPMGK
jgi:hypothetical protein